MDWYTIPNVPFATYVNHLKELYNIKESKSVIQDPFARVLLGDEATSLQTQKVKAVQQNLGNFHQKLLGSFPGWKDLGRGHETGLDIAKDDDTVFIEVKNATNSMNSGSASAVNAKLLKQVELGRKAILVQINTATKGATNRSGIHSTVSVMNGKEAYAYVSGVPDCYDRVLATFSETFRRFTTWKEICEFRDQQLQQA